MGMGEHLAATPPNLYPSAQPACPPACLPARLPARLRAGMSQVDATC